MANDVMRGFIIRTFYRQFIVLTKSRRKRIAHI